MNAQAWLEHAEHLLAERRLAAARVALDQAESVGACRDRCAGNRWLLAMLRGEFESAWQENDALRRRDAPDPHRLWSGEDLRGTRVIVRCLHGFGDAVQMLRYAPHLCNLAESVVFEVAPRFVPLARLFRGVDEVITWGQDAPSEAPEWDVQIEIMELPYLFRTTTAELPIARHYLELPAEHVQQTAAAIGPERKRRIGVVSSCGEWNPHRSPPSHLFESLFKLEGFELWNLEGSDSSASPHAGRMKDAITVCGDGLVALAATIANLDLILTVDTLAAHLAGALGKPAWVMLQHAADWRWMTGRADSPWYPGMRLFRQPRAGDWESVLHSVIEALEVYER